jgi:CDP-diglyceride synthetase
MTSELFAKTTGLFAGLLLTGSGLCLPLYHWKIRSFLASRLWTKVLWWIPIFAVFELCLWGGVGVCVIVAALLAAQCVREYWPQRPAGSRFAPAFVLAVCLGLFHLPMYFSQIPSLAVTALIAVCFASALSDVCAFFCGSFAGRHQLPAWINANKSWEGVAGQVVGSFIGVALVGGVIGIDVSWWLAVGVGLASAAGDIANSIAKRRLGIKDWGHAIPGHGGFLDRLASLSPALAAGFWVTLILA